MRYKYYIYVKIGGERERERMNDINMCMNILCKAPLLQYFPFLFLKPLHHLPLKIPKWDLYICVYIHIYKFMYIYMCVCCVCVRVYMGVCVKDT